MHGGNMSIVNLSNGMTNMYLLQVQTMKYIQLDE